MRCLSEIRDTNIVERFLFCSQSSDPGLFSVMVPATCVKFISWFYASLLGSSAHGFSHGHTASACVWNGEFKKRPFMCIQSRPLLTRYMQTTFIVDEVLHLFSV